MTSPKPATGVGEVIEDDPTIIMDAIARYLGAQAGGRVGGDMGSRLVLAQFGSRQARNLLEHITRDQAAELIKAAQHDPELFRALLTKSTASRQQQARAAIRLHSWLFGTAVPAEGE